MTRDEVLKALLDNADGYINGVELAKKLSLSRTAVWKAIGQLQKEGYEIESRHNKGYCLRSTGDVLSVGGITRHLRHKELRVHVYKSIDSTNTALKALAAKGAEAGLALVAEQQTAGRGRMGRSFYSPAESGLYLSLLLRPTIPAAQAVRLTACAAVAVAETIEELSGRETAIKWVNDVFMDGHKVCGILTEASVDCESGLLHYAVVGIGVNLRRPAGGFPEEIRGVAGAALDGIKVPELRCRLAAGILDRLTDYAENPADPSIFDGYRRRSLVLGREINILAPGRDPEPAVAEDLADDYSLLVRLPDGTTRRLSSGEVSVRL